MNIKTVLTSSIKLWRWLHKHPGQSKQEYISTHPTSKLWLYRGRCPCCEMWWGDSICPLHSFALCGQCLPFPPSSFLIGREEQREGTSVSAYIRWSSTLDILWKAIPAMSSIQDNVRISINKSSSKMILDALEKEYKDRFSYSYGSRKKRKKEKKIGEADEKPNSKKPRSKPRSNNTKSL